MVVLLAHLVAGGCTLYQVPVSTFVSSSAMTDVVSRGVSVLGLSSLMDYVYLVGNASELIIPVACTWLWKEKHWLLSQTVLLQMEICMLPCPVSCSEKLFMLTFINSAPAKATFRVHIQEKSHFLVIPCPHIPSATN